MDLTETFVSQRQTSQNGDCPQETAMNGYHTLSPIQNRKGECKVLQWSLIQTLKGSPLFVMLMIVTTVKAELFPYFGEISLYF